MSSVLLRIQFPEDFEERYEKYKATFQIGDPSPRKKPIVDADGSTSSRATEEGHAEPAPALKEEISVGGLVAFSDGSIRYKGKILDLRPQLKELCRMFMRRDKQVLTHDDIRDKIVATGKRNSTPFVTIAKYVSELHRALKIHFGRDVIFNANQDGWYLDTTKR